jgi:phenylacetate-CoA ligase
MPISNINTFIDTLEACALNEIQLRKFQWGLRSILKSNSFYQNKLSEHGIKSHKDIDSFEAYCQLPFTTKSELVQDQENYLPYGTNLTYPQEQYRRIHQTSGTTGTPLQMLDTEESWNWWAECWNRIYQAAGITAKDRIFFAFSFGPFIGFWSAYAGARLLGALSIPGGGMSSVQRLKAMLTHNVTTLICTPTYALHLAEVAHEEGIDIVNSSIKKTIHAGEPGAGLPATRKRIEEAWGAHCFDHAGATEVGAWGFECDGYDGLYVNEGEFIFEIIDPDSGEQADEGELVISNLGRVGMPVIRYRTGDHVRLSKQPYNGGIKFRKLDGGVIGRVDDVLFVRGINVYPSAIENIIRNYPQVGEFAVDIFRRHELDDMEIRLEVREDADAGEIGSKLATAIRNGLGLRVLLKPVPVGTLPRFDLKARRFNDHRDKDSF